MFSKTVENERTPHRRSFLQLVGVAGVMGGIVPFPGTVFAAEQHNHTAVAAVSGVAEDQTRSAKTSHTAAVLRDLWVGHIFWVRNVSIAIFNTNDAAMKAAEGQAVSNAKSIAATIEPFYGVAAKEAFFKLLAGHYGAVKAYLVATASGDASAQANATQSLTSNAGGDCCLFEQGKSISSEGRIAQSPARAWWSPHSTNSRTEGSQVRG